MKLNDYITENIKNEKEREEIINSGFLEHFKKFLKNKNSGHKHQTEFLHYLSIIYKLSLTSNAKIKASLRELINSILNYITKFFEEERKLYCHKNNIYVDDHNYKNFYAQIKNKLDSIKISNEEMMDFYFDTENYPQKLFNGEIEPKTYPIKQTIMSPIKQERTEIYGDISDIFNSDYSEQDEPLTQESDLVIPHVLSITRITHQEVNNNNRVNEDQSADTRAISNTTNNAQYITQNIQTTRTPIDAVREGYRQIIRRSEAADLTERMINNNQIMYGPEEEPNALGVGVTHDRPTVIPNLNRIMGLVTRFDQRRAKPEITKISESEVLQKYYKDLSNLEEFFCKNKKEKCDEDVKKTKTHKITETSDKEIKAFVKSIMLNTNVLKTKPYAQKIKKIRNTDNDNNNVKFLPTDTMTTEKDLLKTIKIFFKITNRLGKPYLEENVFLFCLYLLTNKTLQPFNENLANNLRENIVCFIMNSNFEFKLNYKINNLDFIDDIPLNKYTTDLFAILTNKNNVKKIDIKQIFNKLKSCDEFTISGYMNLYQTYITYVYPNEEICQKVFFYYFLNYIGYCPNLYIVMGKLAYRNIFLQDLAKKCNILQTLSFLLTTTSVNYPHYNLILFCLYTLTESNEENKKFMWKNGILERLISVLKEKISEKNFDKTFYLIICIFKGISRSVYFNKSAVFEFPILELCFSTVNHIKKFKNTWNFSILDSLCIDNYVHDSETKYHFVIIKEILSILCNLILDNDPFKSKFLAQDGLVLMRKFFKKKSLQYHVLKFLQNYMFESSWSHKDKFLMVFGKKSLNKTPYKPEKTKINYNSKRTKNGKATKVKKANFNYNFINAYLKTNTIKINYTSTDRFYPIIKRYRNVEFTKNCKYTGSACFNLIVYFNLMRNCIFGGNNDCEKVNANFPYIFQYAVIFLLKATQTKEKLSKHLANLVNEIIGVFINLLVTNMVKPEIIMRKEIIEAVYRSCNTDDYNLIENIISLLLRLLEQAKDKNIRNVLKGIGFLKWMEKIDEKKMIHGDYLKSAFLKFNEE